MSLVPGSDVTVSDDAGWKLTYDDLVALPEDRLRHELIDGEHYVTPSPNRKHQNIALNIAFLIRAHLKTHPVGRVFMAPFDVLFSKFDVVEPDVLYMSHARARDVLTSKHVTGAPDLVVEVGSRWTRRRDETLKHALYERFGVEEYWIVDPSTDTIRVFRLVDSRYRRILELSLDRGDTLTTPLLPGLEMPLAEIFED